MVAVLGVTGAASISSQVTKSARPVTVDIAETIGGEELVPAGNAVVHSDVKGILVVGSPVVQDKIVCNPREIGKGIEIDDLLSNRIDAVRWDHKGIARIDQGSRGGIRVGGQGVVDHVTALGKISVPHGQGGNGIDSCYTLAEAGALVIAEDKGPVFLDGSSQIKAELVAAERRFFRTEKVTRVQLVIADKLVDTAA